MPDDAERLPNLEEIRRRLRDLHFSEYDRDHPARQQLSYEHIDGVIERSRATWDRVRAETDSRKLDEVLRRGAPAAPLREGPGMTPLEVEAEAERKQSLLTWAIQRFEELSRKNDLRRIERIGLTIGEWVGILQRGE